MNERMNSFYEYIHKYCKNVWKNEWMDILEEPCMYNINEWVSEWIKCYLKKTLVHYEMYLQIHRYVCILLFYMFVVNCG